MRMEEMAKNKREMSSLIILTWASRDCIQRETWCMGPYAGVDYNLTLSQLRSWLQHMHHGQPNARFDLNPIPESTLSPSGTKNLASGS